MILLPGKKPIIPTKLLHQYNHLKPRAVCVVHKDHLPFIKQLNYTLNEPVFNLDAGLYRLEINGVSYIIDVYYKLINGDFIMVHNEHDIRMCYNVVERPIIPYKLLSTPDMPKVYTMENVMNGAVDMIMVTGKSTFVSGTVSNPGTADRITGLHIKTSNGNDYQISDIPLKNTIGNLPNGATDFTIIDTARLISHDGLFTTREILSGTRAWELLEDLSDESYYVFYADHNNVKPSNNPNSLRCTHFESVTYDTLVNKSTKKNCICCDPKKSGIYVKLDTKILDIHGEKKIVDEFSKWILNQAVGNYPIYIEYELNRPYYNTFLIDEYHLKTWYKTTTIEEESNKLSVFYKTIESL